MRLLIVTDFHYAGQGVPSVLPERRSDLTLTLLDAVRKQESSPDAVLCLGDVVDNGLSDAALNDWTAVREALARFDAPILAIPGNHDRDNARFASVFGEPAPLTLRDSDGLRVRLIPFADTYDERDVCSRDFARMERVFADIRPDEVTVVCQHNTVLPEIRSDYPYTPLRCREIADREARAGVRLSLSGHYHDGLAPFREDGVTYACVPALCEAPFRYAVAELTRDTVRVTWKNAGAVKGF